MEFPESSRKRIILSIPTVLKQGMTSAGKNYTHHLKSSFQMLEVLDTDEISDLVTPNDQATLRCPSQAGFCQIYSVARAGGSSRGIRHKMKVVNSVSA